MKNKTKLNLKTKTYCQKKIFWEFYFHYSFQSVRILYVYFTFFCFLIHFGKSYIVGNHCCLSVGKGGAACPSGKMWAPGRGLPRSWRSASLLEGLDFWWGTVSGACRSRWWSWSLGYIMYVCLFCWDWWLCSEDVPRFLGEGNINGTGCCVLLCLWGP